MIEYSARITSQGTPRVGGRNLLLNSDKSLSNKEYYVGRYDISDPSLMVADEYYTIQIWGAAEGADYSGSMWVYNSGGNTCVADIQKNENGVWQMTFKWRDDSEKLNRYLNLFRSANHPSIKKGYSTTIARIKLERGSIATDWTPAPEDVNDRISTVNTSLVSLASTLLDPNEGDIPQLFRQQENLSHAIGFKASQEDLNKYVTNIADVTNAIQSQLCDMSVFGISNSGYVDVKTRDTCPAPGQTILNGDLYAPTEYHTSQIRLTLRTDHDALARQVSDLQLQLNRCNLRLTATKQELDKLKATTAITPVLNTDTRKRSGSTTLYPQYGDWLLTSDSQEQYISFSGLSAEIGRSIYIQTRRKAYLNANGHSFFGLPSVSENQWLSNNTTYRFVRSDATSWLVTSSASPYPWT